MKTPQLPEKDIRAILEANGVDQSKVAVVAIRGYYLDSIGKKGENERGHYDDSHFIVWPDGIARFVGNTDPNGYRAGIATLCPGVWTYGTGMHKGKIAAFRGCEPFTVLRDGNPPRRDTGMFAINWHPGGGDENSVGTTWSAGCQTNPPEAWRVLKPLLYSLLETCDNPRRKNDWGETVRSFKYVLIEETERRKGNLRVA
jgi:lysozyme